MELEPSSETQAVVPPSENPVIATLTPVLKQTSTQAPVEGSPQTTKNVSRVYHPPSASEMVKNLIAFPSGYTGPKLPLNPTPESSSAVPASESTAGTTTPASPSAAIPNSSSAPSASSAVTTNFLFGACFPTISGSPLNEGLEDIKDGGEKQKQSVGITAPQFGPAEHVRRQNTPSGVSMAPNKLTQSMGNTTAYVPPPPGCWNNGTHPWIAPMAVPGGGVMTPPGISNFVFGNASIPSGLSESGAVTQRSSSKGGGFGNSAGLGTSESGGMTTRSASKGGVGLGGQGPAVTPNLVEGPKSPNLKTVARDAAHSPPVISLTQLSDMLAGSGTISQAPIESDIVAVSVADLNVIKAGINQTLLTAEAKMRELRAENQRLQMNQIRIRNMAPPDYVQHPMDMEVLKTTTQAITMELMKLNDQLEMMNKVSEKLNEWFISNQGKLKQRKDASEITPSEYLDTSISHCIKRVDYLRGYHVKMLGLSIFKAPPPQPPLPAYYGNMSPSPTVATHSGNIASLAAAAPGSTASSQPYSAGISPQSASNKGSADPTSPLPVNIDGRRFDSYTSNKVSADPTSALPGRIDGRRFDSYTSNKGSADPTSALPGRIDGRRFDSYTSNKGSAEPTSALPVRIDGRRFDSYLATQTEPTLKWRASTHRQPQRQASPERQPVMGIRVEKLQPISPSVSAAALDVKLLKVVDVVPPPDDSI